MIRPLNTLLIFSFAVFIPFFAHAQSTSADFGNNAIQVGYDSRDCDGSLAGSIRYSSGIPGPTSGLIHYWPLDETSGSSIADVVGGLTTTWDDSAINDVAEETVAGVIGNALSFNGNVEIDAASFTIPTTGTFAMWLKFDSTGSTYRYFGSDNNYELIKNSSDELEGDIFDSNGANSSFTITAGTWVHMVYTYDEPSNTSNIYINGSFDATGDADSNVVSGTITLGIGHRFGYGGDELEGDLDDVRFYNRVLSPAEVTTLYNATTPTTAGMQYCDGSDWQDLN